MFDLCTRIAPSEIFDLIKDNFEKLTRIEGDSDGSGLRNTIERLDESKWMAPGDPGAGESVDGLLVASMEREDAWDNCGSGSLLVACRDKIGTTA